MRSSPLLRLPLLPIAKLYGAVSARAIVSRQRKAFRSTLPVLSVGNLSVGGTGKTPLVLWLLDHLQERAPVVVLSRGYGRGSGGDRVWMAGEPPPDPEVFGDEPALIGRSIRRGALGVGADRGALLRELQRRLADAVAILDDGFQHRQVARDLDIVIVDERTARLPYPFPAGVLREPPRALARASVIVATSPNAAEWASGFVAPGTPVVRGGVRVAGLRTWETGEPAEPTAALLVTGVAQPERVRAAANGLGVPVVKELRFRDHHRYRSDDAARLMRTMRNSSAEILLTTSKDAVKLERLAGLLPRLHVIDVRFEIEDDRLLWSIIGEVIAVKG